MGYEYVGMVTILFNSALFAYFCVHLDDSLTFLKILFGWVSYIFMYLSYGYAMAAMRALSAPETVMKIMASFFGTMTYVTYFATVILMLAGLVMGIQWVKRLMIDAKNRKFNAGTK